MTHIEIHEGTAQELMPFMKKHPNQRFRLIALDAIPRNERKLIRKGMFPELGEFSEEDFKSAEWHDKNDL
jgi:hypothetical protein